MNTMVHLNQAMAYIEDHLGEEIDFSKLTRIACCSEYHFRRMFSFLAGMPLGEYIRRRRLSLGAVLLQKSSIRVIDLALQLGYESPDAFTRAFTAMHGATPTQVRRGEAAAHTFAPMTFQLTIKGGSEMEYRVVEKEAFSIVGLCKRITLQFEGVNHQIDSLWQQLTPERIAQLKSLCNTEPKGMLSVSADFADHTQEGSEVEQYIGVATTLPAPKGWEVLPVEASTWAVFGAVGPFPQALQSVWARIYAEWFPTSGYELTGGPEMLWNESPDTTRPDYRSEIWIPVRQLPE